METKKTNGNIAVYGTTKEKDDIVIKRIVKEKELVESTTPVTAKVKRVKVKKVTVVENQDVYDIAVEGNRNFFANKHLVHNCYEIGMIPISKDGVLGFQMCNLSSINGGKINSINKYKEAVEVASILGTLQAGYTDFPYLGKASQEITEEEALLGVSITGLMDNPTILLDEKNQYMMAKLAVKINKKWANKLGINQASRVTAIKPEGCLSKESEIRTTKGNKSLETIFNENDVTNFDKYEKGSFIKPTKDIYVYDENNNEQKIDKLFVNGLANVYKLIDENNNVYEFTGNHLLKTRDGWKRVDELSKGDDIISFSLTSKVSS